MCALAQGSSLCQQLTLHTLHALHALPTHPSHAGTLSSVPPPPRPGLSPLQAPPLYLPPFCLSPHIVWEPVPEGGQPFIQKRAALLPAELEDLHEGLQARGSITEALRRGAPSLTQGRPNPGSPHRPRAGPAGESRVLHARVTS